MYRKSGGSRRTGKVLRNCVKNPHAVFQRLPMEDLMADERLQNGACTHGERRTRHPLAAPYAKYSAASISTARRTDAVPWRWASA